MILSSHLNVTYFRKDENAPKKKETTRNKMRLVENQIHLTPSCNEPYNELKF